MKKLLPWILLGGGVYLLLMGTRELLEPWFVQSEVEQAWSPTPQGIELGDAVARLSIPRLDSQWYVMKGTSKRDLRMGPGHLPGTAAPGARGNCVIAAHRDTQFRVLKDIRKGDDILVDTQWGQFRYRVTGLSIVGPQNTEPIAPSRNPVLSLITCYPFYYVGPAPKRFVVSAELAEASAWRVRPPS